MRLSADSVSNAVGALPPLGSRGQRCSSTSGWPLAAEVHKLGGTQALTALFFTVLSISYLIYGETSLF
jgi:hypothetical protein